MMTTTVIILPRDGSFHHRAAAELSLSSPTCSSFSFLCWAHVPFPRNPSPQGSRDLLLASATVPAISLFFKNYFEQNLHKETKLGARLMNWFILICIVVGVLLSMTLLHGMRG